MKTECLQSNKKAKLLDVKVCGIWEGKIGSGKSQPLRCTLVAVLAAELVLESVVKSQFKSIVRSILKSSLKKKI